MASDRQYWVGFQEAVQKGIRAKRELDIKDELKRIVDLIVTGDDGDLLPDEVDAVYPEALKNPETEAGQRGRSPNWFPSKPSRRENVKRVKVLAARESAEMHRKLTAEVTTRGNKLNDDLVAIRKAFDAEMTRINGASSFPFAQCLIMAGQGRGA